MVLSLSTTEKSLGLSSLYPPFRYLYTLMRFSLSSQLLQPFLTEENLQSLNHPCGPSLDCLQYVCVSFVLQRPQVDTGPLKLPRTQDQPHLITQQGQMSN